MPGAPRYAYFLAFTLGAGGYVFASPQVHGHFATALAFFVALLFVVLLWVTAITLSGGFSKPASCHPGFLLLLALVGGASINHFHLNHRIDRQLPQHLEGLDLTVDAQILGLARHNGKAWVFDAWIENARLSDADALRDTPSVAKALAAVRGKVRLSWYQAQLDDSSLAVGQLWTLQLRLRRPRGLVNPGGFDYQAWLLARSYIATGYIRAASAAADAAQPPALRSGNILINRLRQRIQQRLFAGGAEPGEGVSATLSSAKVQQALLLGDKSGLTAADWSLLQSTGTVHLMAISGLHVGLVAALAFFLGRVLVRLLPGSALLLLLPALSSVAAASFYAAVAGFSIPTQRALLLVLLFNVAYCSGKRLNPFDVLASAAAMVVVIDPFAFLSPGFWLSFSAVWVLIYCFGLHRAPGGKWRGMVLSQWVVAAGLLVPLAALGLPTSVSAPLANVIAIPVISLLVVPGLFLALALSAISQAAAGWVLQRCDQLLNLLWHYLELLQHLPVSQLWLAGGQSMLVLALLGGLGGALFLAPRGLGVRGLGLALLILVLAPAGKREPGLVLTVLDVGQGLAVVMR
ncbi:MAG: ComEC family competence protein, partial [Cellvibrionaceae bacterium]|nr:ComEC family competence protein [Cellvibrionaceae bacterium]